MEYIGILTEATPISSPTDLASYDQRFEAVRNRLIWICTGLVGPDEAEDVVHDTYLRARDRIGQLHDPGNFDAWVARTAVHLCYNRHRSIRRLRQRLPDLAVAGVRSGRDAELRALVEALPARERTVIVLHYGHGYRTDELATLLETSPSNVRSILHRTRGRLRREFGES